MVDEELRQKPFGKSHSLTNQSVTPNRLERKSKSFMEYPFSLSLREKGKSFLHRLKERCLSQRKNSYDDLHSFFFEGLQRKTHMHSLFQLQEEEIEFDLITQVPKSGKIESVIKWIVTHNTNETIKDSFLWSFRTYLSPLDLFNLLYQLYLSVGEQPILPSEKYKEQELIRWNKKCLITFTQKLLKKCSQAELKQKKQGQSILKQLRCFWIDLIADGFGSESYAIQNFLKEFKQFPSPKLEFTFFEPSPVNINELSFAVSEMASHMHWIEFSLFQNISIYPEFFESNWSKPNKKTVAPNLTALIERFNQTSYWISTQIATSKTIKQMISNLKFFISVAHECRLRKNYNGVMEVIGGLNSSIVQSFRTTWQQLPSKYLERYKELDDLMNCKHNYANYRKELSVSSNHKHVLPYVGIFLRDLTFVEEGNESNFGDFINYQKLDMFGRTLLEISCYQQQENIALSNKNPSLISVLTNMYIVEEEELWRRKESFE